MPTQSTAASEHDSVPTDKGPSNALPIALNRRTRILSLDIARACAALAVFLFHYGIFPFGHLGVELFFLLSGFVLALPSRHRNALAFFRARCVRLYPTYWVALSLTLLTLLWSGEKLSLPTVAANVTMLTAFLGQPYVDGVYWSLTEEIIFYVLVGATGSYHPQRNPLVLAALMALACCFHATLVGSGVIALAENGAISKATMAVKFLPFFSGGMATATLFRRFGKNEVFSMHNTAVALLLCVLAPFLTIFYDYSLHLPDSLSPYKGAAVGGVFGIFYLLIVGASCEHRCAGNCVGIPAMVVPGISLLRAVAFFGASTYPFYLLHERFTKTVSACIGFRICGSWGLLMLFCAVAALSMLIHIGIEKRISTRFRRMQVSDTFGGCLFQEPGAATAADGSIEACPRSP